MTIVEHLGSKPPVGRGRPKRELVDTVRVILWHQFIREKSGLSNYGIEKELAGGKFKRNAFGDVIRHCQWDKYAVGKTTPGASLVDKMDLKYPGSKEILNHKIWSLFRVNPPTDDHLRLLLSEIRPSLVKYIGVLPNDFRFPLVNERTFSSLIKLKKIYVKKNYSGLDHLVALLVLASDGMKKRQVHQYQCSIGCILYLLPAICGVYFEGVADEFYKMFSDHYLFGGVQSEGYRNFVARDDGIVINARERRITLSWNGWL